jgi:hypothetical protein
MSCYFKGTTPCNSCPYRMDAPLQLWDKAEFEDLLASEKDYIGKLYQCHKNNGTVCRGWLIDQDNRRLPSIALRMQLSKENITREYLDKLHCKAPLYGSIEEMVKANYPEIITKSQSIK